jgi:hypothetical protein
MQVRSIAKILDVLIIVPFLFAVSGKHHIQPNYLLMAGVLAFIAIAFRGYKNLEFNDRFLLAFQVLIFAVIAALFLPYSLSIEGFAERMSLPVEQVYALLFYAILIIIGIYSTFWTQAGFIGVVGDPQVVRKDSLILLACVIGIALGVILVPNSLSLWLPLTAILWRCILYYKWHTWGF